MKDPYLVPVRSDEDYDEAEQLRKRLSVKCGGLQNLGILYKDAKGKYDTSEWLSAACYACLGYNPNRYAKAIFFVDWATKCYTDYEFHKDKELNAIAMRLATWLVEDSVFKNMFVTKDPEELLTKPTIYHTQYPLRFIINGAMILRYLYEHQAVIKTWDVFRQSVGPDAAWILSNFFQIREDKLVQYNTTGHAIFDSGEENRPAILNNFLDRDFTYIVKDEPMETHPYEYRRLSKIWADPRETNFKLPPYDVNQAGARWGEVAHWKVDNVEKVVREILKLNRKEGKRKNA